MFWLQLPGVSGSCYEDIKQTRRRHFGDEDAGIVGDVDKFLREGN